MRECRTKLRSRIKLKLRLFKIRLVLVHKLVTLFVLSLYRDIYIYIKAVGRSVRLIYKIFTSVNVAIKRLQQSAMLSTIRCTSKASPVYCLEIKDNGLFSLIMC